jgi:hypothetical protein
MTAVTHRTAHAPDMDDDEPTYTRLGVNIALDVADALKGSCRRKGISVTEGVRRAIALWKLVEDEMASGKRVQIYDPETNATRDLLFL